MLRQLNIVVFLAVLRDLGQNGGKEAQLQVGCLVTQIELVRFHITNKHAYFYMLHRDFGSLKKPDIKVLY